MRLSVVILTLLSTASAKQPLPSITLPWGTWQANSLSSDSYAPFYTFSNIRFGAAPTGTARFKAPTSPSAIPDPKQLMDNSYGPMCHQVKVKNTNCPTAPVSKLPQSEDCLFLDIYVPKSVLEKAQSSGTSNTPIVVWIYGGAFIFGSKNSFESDVPFYTGTGLLESTSKFNKDVIFVTGNYRVGAFGWLAGPTMEDKTTAATPNAGLYDQRLLLQWVQNYIHLFGGDKTQVTVWGESAGASSIEHHLLSMNGTQDPLFHKAFMQSPAFQWQWDRTANGTLQQVYRNFTDLAKCDGMDCLRKAPIDVLVNASQQLYDNSQLVGLFPLGPAIDNKLIWYLPAVAFAKKKFWSKLDSLVVSHVGNESASFLPSYIKTPADFNFFVKNFILEDSLDYVRTRIEEQYPATGGLYHGDQQARAAAVIRDSTFTCNTRQIYDAYNQDVDTYMIQYDFGGEQAKHATDLVSTFWNKDFEVHNFLRKYVCLGTVNAYLAAAAIDVLAPRYQDYLASWSIFGDPNKGYKWVDKTNWKKAKVSEDGDYLTDVMQVLTPHVQLPIRLFNMSSIDIINTHSICDFWTQAAFNFTKTSKELLRDEAAIRANGLEPHKDRLDEKDYWVVQKPEL